MQSAFTLKGMTRMGWLAIAVTMDVVDATPAEAQVPVFENGVVVEEVGEGSTLEKAGLRPGDIVLAWERLPAPANPQGAQGTIESVFDWMWLEVEQAPRGTVKLTGERGGEVKIFEVEPGDWKATLRASMPEGMLEDYERGLEYIEAEDRGAGIDLWHKVAGAAESLAAGHLRCWLLLRIGDAWGKLRRWEKTHGAYRSALDEAKDPLAKVAVWQAVGDAYKKASEFESAREAYGSAQEIRERTWGESLALARGLHDLGVVNWRQGGTDSAQGHFHRAQEIRQKLAPGSIDVATSLNGLGILAFERGDLDRATEYYEGALEIRQKLAPGSIGVAMSLNNLGCLASDRGDLDRATENHEEALAIKQKLAAGSLSVAASLNNLGNLASDRGDLDRAADYHERALEILQKLAPGSIEVGANLMNLGNVAHKRGDLDRAAEYHERGLEITQEVAPGSLNFAIGLNNLGNVTYALGDLERAAESYQGALKIREMLTPGGLGVATILNNMGRLASEGEDLGQAVEYFARSLAIRTSLAPGSLGVATSLKNLGAAAARRDDLDRAVDLYEVSLAIQQKLAPGSLMEAKILYDLATIRRMSNQPQLALSLFQQALQALEYQGDRLGGSRDVQADFRAERVAYYRDTIDLSLEIHQEAEAFHTLERSRAQSFLDQFAERDLVFSDVPEKLERHRRRIAHRYDQTQDKITRLHPRDQAEEIETLLTRLRQLRRDYEDITEEIIEASPKLGALRYPQPLELDEGRQALDPGTLMLSYSVDKDETHLFVLTREEELRTFTLPIGEEELRGDVEKVLEFQKRRSAPLLYTKPLLQAGERLYQALVQPTEEWIVKSKRVLIVPDGPLHLLPFALLVRKTGPGKGHGGRDFEYLVEWKPLHSALSATVYAELKSQRRSQPDEGADGLALAAFGDPRYSSESSGDDLANDRRVDVYVRAAAKRGFDFRPLPYSREEVHRIAALYPEGAARTYLGAKASEEQAKSVGKNARILHFATHGRFNDRFPLDSYLALTVPKEFRKDQDNGLLQAWEIYENVRLDADLVVLSACESGLGDEIAGEGLKGLTRAFQFAGARTVAPTLWKVEDRATAELMVRFYRHLRSGMAKDEALRAAQMELIRGPVKVKNRQGQIVERDLSAPYYWAAFQLIGDWQ